MFSKSQRIALVIASIAIGAYLLVMQNHPVGWVLLFFAGGLIYYQIRHNPAEVALVKLSQGDLETAQRLLLQMGNPEKLPIRKKATYYLATGWVELKSGNLKACQEHVQQALDLGLRKKNDQACANLLLAKVYASQGASEHAQQHLMQAKQIEHDKTLAADIAQFETEITIAIQYDLTIKAERIHRHFDHERESLIQAAHQQKEALETEYEAKMAQLKAELENKLMIAREEKEAELAAALEKRDQELAKLEQEQQFQDQKKIEQIISLELDEKEALQHTFDNALHASHVATDMFSQTLKQLNQTETGDYLQLQIEVEERFRHIVKQIQQQIPQHQQTDSLRELVDDLQDEYELELINLQNSTRLNRETTQIIKYPSETHQLIYDVFQLLRAIKLRAKTSYIKETNEP